MSPENRYSGQQLLVPLALELPYRNDRSRVIPEYCRGASFPDSDQKRHAASAGGSGAGSFVERSNVFGGNLFTQRQHDIDGGHHP